MDILLIIFSNLALNGQSSISDRNLSPRAAALKRREEEKLMSMGGPAGMPGMPGFPPGLGNPFEPPGAKRPRTDSGLPGFPGPNPYDGGLGGALMNQIPGPPGSLPGIPISTFAPVIQNQISAPNLANPGQNPQNQLQLTPQNIQNQVQNPAQNQSPQNIIQTTIASQISNTSASEAQLQAERNLQEANKQASEAPGSTVVDNDKK